MCKKSVSERNEKRKKMVEKFAGKRKKLLATANDLKTSPKERYKARIALQKMPKDSSRVRVVRRCNITGRAHAVYKLTGLSRIKLREFSMLGFIPGIRKSSW